MPFIFTTKFDKYFYFIKIKSYITSNKLNLVMGNKPINFKDKFNKFNDKWSPKVIAEMNDYQFKLVKIEGDFVWHKHEETDEVFIVIDGKMEIEFRNKTVKLESGEMFVVPKNVEHKPKAEKECRIMIIEPRGIINTGQAVSSLTSENDIWI